MLGVMISSLVSDFSALRPTLVSQISAGYYLFFNMGSVVGLGTGAELLQPTRTDHGCARAYTPAKEDATPDHALCAPSPGRSLSTRACACAAA